MLISGALAVDTSSVALQECSRNATLNGMEAGMSYYLASANAPLDHLEAYAYIMMTTLQLHVITPP